jgi:hypothetical protein
MGSLIKAVTTPQNDLKEYKELVDFWLTGEVDHHPRLDDIDGTIIDLAAKMREGIAPKEVAQEILSYLYPGVKPSWVVDAK